MPIYWRSSGSNWTVVPDNVITVTASSTATNTMWMPRYSGTASTIIGTAPYLHSTWYIDQTAPTQQWSAPAQMWIDMAEAEPQSYHPPDIAAPAVIRRPRQLSEEARQHREQSIQRSNELAARRAAASERARALLLEHLTPEQRRTFTEHEWFMVEGGLSKARYCIRVNARSLVANTDQIIGDRVVSRLCAHCANDIPFEDHLLAQKIMIELAEGDFLQIANRHPVPSIYNTPVFGSGERWTGTS